MFHPGQPASREEVATGRVTAVLEDDDPLHDREPIMTDLEARTRLTSCTACPHDCAVDRWRGELGRCGVGRHAVVASAFPHHGEEACLVGRHGSGTIFFAGCNLACVFCQNWDLSQRVEGTPLEPAALADEISPDTHVNLMAQYRPCHQVGCPTEGGGRLFTELARRPSGSEYATALAAARAAGLWRLDGVDPGPDATGPASW